METVNHHQEIPLTVPVHIEIQPELKELATKAANDADMPLNHFIAKLLARHLKRPDLAAIPYKRLGRRPKQSA